MVTISFYLSDNYSIVCSPQFLFLVLDHGLTNSITALVFCKVAYMKMKSKRYDVRNIVGISLTITFLICVTFIYFAIANPIKMTRTSYRYVNECTLSSITYGSFNFTIIFRFIVLYTGFLILNHTVIWGTKKELLSLCVLIIVYCFFRGIHHIYIPSCHFLEELLENIFRIGFFLCNCFVFIWLYDDSKKVVKSVKKTDFFSISIWNQELLACFKNFLKFRRKYRLLTFFENEFIPGSLNWNRFKVLLGIHKELK